LRYRVASIHPYEDYGASGTKTKDIDITDVISRIEIIAYFINGDATQADHPAANVSKLELVDGSDVLYSLTGKCAQVVDYYDRKKTLSNNCSRSIGHAQQAIFGINFGRYLWDPLLAFDPNKFKNPQLKITWNEAIANAACTVNGFRIDAYCFDEFVPTPGGFLMDKEIFSYAPAANAYEYIQLPTDYPYRRMFLQALVAGIDIGALLSEFKLSENEAKKIPFDTTFSEEWNRHVRNYDLYREWINTHAETIGQTLNITPVRAFYVAGGQNAGTYGIGTVFNGWPGVGGQIKLWASINSPEVMAEVGGYAPHGALDFPFGKEDIIEDWYDVTKLGSLKFRVKAGASALSTHTFRVLLQQHRKY